MKNRILLVAIACVILLLAIIVVAILTKGNNDPKNQFKKTFGFSLPDEAVIVNYNASPRKWRIELTEDQYKLVRSELDEYLKTASFEKIPFPNDESKESYYSMLAFKDFYDINDEHIWGGDMLKKEHVFVKHCDYTHIAFTRDADGRYYHG